MGRASLEPWLADFLWEEIATVITWKKEIAAREIKPDPDSRFSDDGSNFRSQNHGGSNVVQLIKVLSVKDGATVILSDSRTSIKARLSSDAISVLEEETEEEFGFETTHDVFQLKEFTVVSTPLGEDDGHVQLSVEKIEYEHHLRKTKGEPTLVQQDENIQQLIQDIVELRYPHLATEDQEEPSQDPEPASHVLSQQNGSSSGSAPTVVVPRSSKPASKRQSQASSLQMQTQRQTQHPVPVQKKVSPPKPLGRTLPKDGFEFEAGVNLDSPVGPSTLSDLRLNKMSAGVNLGSPQAREAKRSHLMALFQTRKTPPEPRTRQPAAHQIEATQKSPDIVIAETPAKPRDQSVELQVLSSSEDGASPDNNAGSSRSPPSAQPIPQPTQSSLRSSGRSGVAHRRHKIPKDQQKLLDHPSSWLPPLPGHQFPRPNVPIALLQQWNQASLAFGNASQPANVSSTAEAEDSASSMDTSDSSDDSDEEFPESQWPPTPPQKRPALPPDSSFGSRPGSSGDLEVAAPRPLPVRKSPLKQVQHSLPQRPAVTVSPYFPDQSQPLFVSQAPSQPSPGLKRPFSEDSPLQSSPEAASQTVTPEQKQQAGPREPFVTNSRSSQHNSQSAAFESRKRPRTDGSSPDDSHSPFKSSLPSRTSPNGPRGWSNTDSISTTPYARPLSWRDGGSPAAASSSVPDGPRGWSSREPTRRNSLSRPMSGRDGDSNVAQAQLSHSTPPASAPRGPRVTDHYSPYSYHNPPMVGRQPSRRNDESNRPASRQGDDLRRFSYQAPTASRNGQDQSSTSTNNVPNDKPRKNSLHDLAELTQNSSRSEWIQQRYVPDARGDLSFFEIRWNYMKMHDDDDVTPTGFREAVLTAFPDMQTDAYRTRFIRLGPGATATKQGPVSLRKQNGPDPDSPHEDRTIHGRYRLAERNDPAEQNRAVRRDFMQNNRRSDWLKARYVTDVTGNLSFSDVQATYINQHRDDAVADNEFREAVLTAFPEYDGNVYRATFTRRLPQSMATNPPSASATGIPPSQNGQNHSLASQDEPADSQAQLAEVGDPAELNRTVRREFIQNRKLSDWVRKQYAPDEKGALTFDDVCSAYRSMDSDEQKSDSKLKMAIETAFPGHYTGSSGTKYTSLHPAVESTLPGQQRLQVQPDKTDPAETPKEKHLSEERQIQWLQEHYILDEAGNSSFDSVWQAYNSMYRSGEVKKSKFRLAAQRAFPEADKSGHEMGFMRRMSKGAAKKAEQRRRQVEQLEMAKQRVGASLTKGQQRQLELWQR